MSRARLLRHPGGRRVELHVLPNGDGETWTLVAIAGAAGTAPEPPECQGPYHSSAQARGAIHRIAALLHERGFVDATDQLMWELPAARAAREIRSERRRHLVDSTFIPPGLPPEES